MIEVGVGVRLTGSSAIVFIGHLLLSARADDRQDFVALVPSSSLATCYSRLDSRTMCMQQKAQHEIAHLFSDTHIWSVFSTQQRTSIINIICGQNTDNDGH